ncbi:hypothetical protein DPMN_015708 [Dreissena polymorpha]|uniref:Uncharacterized protein n=1 Tax=Dreissena polymorpha TaxID=45954 RepID=A0A9D4NDB9_DREPO|nr:hypothetical protein DPMN_015708 [Dreissena polymorpha]
MFVNACGGSHVCECNVEVVMFVNAMWRQSCLCVQCGGSHVCECNVEVVMFVNAMWR